MTPMHARSGFTIVELLVATAVMVSLIALVYTVWRSTFTTINRSRAIVALDLRTRGVADLVQDTVDNRSGCMPLALQNESYSRAWFHRVYAFQANKHVGGTVDSSTKLTVVTPPPSSIRFPVRWVRDETGKYTWQYPGPALGSEPPIDAYSPLKPVKSGTSDLASLRWGLGRTAIWLGGAMPYDGSASYVRGGGTTAGDRRWTMLGASTQSYGTISAMSGTQNIPANTMNWAIAGGRYLPGLTSATRTSGPILGHNPLGPYRGVSITPWGLDQTVTADAWPWLGETHALRIINGPAFPGEPNRRGDPAWSPTRTEADAGVATGSREPDWFTGASPGGVQGPRPAYGTVVQDGNVQWRVEGNTLFTVGPIPFPEGERAFTTLLHMAPTSVNVAASRGRSYVGMMGPAWINGHASQIWMDRVPYVPTLERFVGDGTSGQPHSAHLAAASIMSSPHTKNLSQFTIEPTGRWTGIPATARGRFESLTIGARARGLSSTTFTNANPDMYDWGGLNSPTSLLNNTINAIVTEPDGAQAVVDSASTLRMPAHHVAGFQGSSPTGMDQPGHPPVLMLTIGLVGGFSSLVQADPLDRRPRDSNGIPIGIFTNPSAIERRWTVGGGIR
ncbi:MAG: hypothetical protein RLZZ127_1063 [Planctomycetota bacterium]|jgi:prepilin-type N-terminal cleavage/methylation domain-containing protein